MATRPSTRRTILALCRVLLQVMSLAGLLILAGCSTAPVADMLDFFAPGRFPKDAKSATGGVCIQQGGPAGGLIGPPVAPPIVPGGPVVTTEPPPPAPIGATPMPGFGK